MKKDMEVFLKHIAESVEKIEEFTRGLDKDEFKKSVIVQDAVMRRLEIIGEAAKSIAPDFRKKHPEIAWSEMSKTRDKLIHGYFGVDIDLTWDIVINDLPALKEQIKSILMTFKNDAEKASNK